MQPTVARSSSSRRSARRSGAATPRRATTRTRTRTSCSARCYTEVIERAGIDADAVEDVICGCVQQYGEQMFNVGAQRLAAGRAAGRDAGHDRRPPVRLGPAGRQLRRRADRRRRARRRHRRRRRAHGPHPDGRRLQVGRRRRLAVAARDDGALQPRAAGHLGRDDRRQVGDPALGDRRARRALAPARRAQATEEGRFERETIPFQVNGDTYVADQGIRPDTNLEALARPQAGVQARRQGHGRQLVADLRRRRGGAADVGRQGAASSASRRARGSSTRRRSASTR